MVLVTIGNVMPVLVKINCEYVYTLNKYHPASCFQHSKKFTDSLTLYFKRVYTNKTKTECLKIGYN